VVHAIRRTLFLLTALVATSATGGSGEERLPPSSEGSFSIAVIPDTQAYRGRGAKATPLSLAPVTNAIFDAHTQWIVDNLDAQRIVFVSHVGDIVDRNEPEQWAVARQAMDRLHGRVPYAIALGNHDLKASGDAALFQKHFPAERFVGVPWYGGTPSAGLDARYGNNANSFQLFSAGGLDFVMLHLECNAPDPVLQWADKVLAEHASRRAIVASHMNLGPLAQPKKPDDYFAAPKGRMQWKKVHGAAGNTPQQMWDKCFRRHANVFLILSGDQSRTQALRQVSQNDAGRPVHEVLSDYMATTGSGDCWMRICRFLPAENRIDVFTIDSRTGQLCPGTKLVPQRDAHQFSLPYRMSGA